MIKNQRFLRRLLHGYVIVLILVACQNEKKTDSSMVTESPKAEATKVTSDVKILELPWVVSANDTTDLLEIKKNPTANSGNLTADNIIGMLNSKYPKIKLEWVGQKGNVAFVKIADAAYLTQQMGSTGPQAYFAESTFSLTEIKGINAVHYDFIEGDHASPQTFTRDSFKGFN